MENSGLLLDSIHHEDRPAMIEHMKEMSRECSSKDHESIDFRIVHKSGRIVWIAHRCSAVHGSDGEWLGVRVSNRDITERKNAETALRESEENTRAMLNATRESAFLMDPDGLILAHNSKLSERLGLGEMNLLGRNVYGLLPEETAAHRRRKVREAIDSRRPVDFEDERAGAVFENIIYPILDASGEVTRLAVFAADITDRKRSEELLRRGAEEKEALLRELQHRIKNTLAMITSLVHIEIKGSRDSSSRVLLENIRSRIGTLSSLYAMLYSTGAVRRVRLDCYLRMIGDSVVAAYAQTGADIRLGMTADEVLIDTKRASSIGLIVNELLMNSFKYAFAGRGQGSIEVCLARTKEGMELVVSDDGVGLPAGFDPARSEGFGLRLVSMLLEQLGGTLSHRTVPGTPFTIGIPLRD